MPYIGNQPAEQFTSFATQTFSVSATTSYTLDHAVTNENEIALFVNNVRQQPGSGKAYTATGTALTLSAATASTDTMYCVFLGRALQTVTPATNSITAAMVGNDLISGKDALAAIPATTDELLISDAGTLKRIDASFFQNTPAFYASKDSNQTITSATTTKITFETELFDSDSTFASSRFTPAVAGKYYIETGLTMQGGTSELIESRIYIYKNGSEYSYGYGAHQNNYSNYEARTWSSIVDCDTDDYVEIYSRCSDSSGDPNILQHTKGTYFMGYKLIGA